MDGDDNYPTKREKIKQILLTVFCLFPMWLAVAHFSDKSKADVAVGSIVGIGLGLKVSWELKKHLWFWVTIGFLALAHIWLIVNFH
jgi:hypothetical protein